MVWMAIDICMAMGERIRALRTHRGWRQIDLAVAAGINENYVSDLESAKKEVCLRTLQALANSFDLTVRELFNGVE